MTMFPDQVTLSRFPDLETLDHVTLFPDQETHGGFPDLETILLSSKYFLIREHVTRMGIRIPVLELYRTVSWAPGSTGQCRDGFRPRAYI